MHQGSLARGAGHLRSRNVRNLRTVNGQRRHQATASVTLRGAGCEILEGRVLLSTVTNLELNTGDLIRGAAGFSDIWSSIDRVVTPRGGQSFIRAEETRPYRLDAADLRQTLGRAPLEFTPAANRPLELALPTPGGDVSRFAIVEAPIMEPALAAKFPGIKTYRGQGIDDPTASIRLDYTPQGFHAQVLSPQGSFAIEPYFHLDKSVYAAYWRTDVAGIGDEPFCLFEGDHAEHGHDDADHDHADGNADHAHDVAGRDIDGAVTGDADGQSTAGRVGTQLRTYRAAVAATGEYTSYHGGTVSAG